MIFDHSSKYNKIEALFGGVQPVTSYVIRHNKTGLMLLMKKKVIFLLSKKKHFVSSYMISVMCELNAVLYLYGKSSS